MTAAGDGHDPGRDDRGVGRRVQEAYATRVGIDTAARHLWTMDQEARRLRRRRRRQRLVSAAASLMVLMAAGGTVAGSAVALPGEVLYPVKESLERAELTIAFSDTADARAHLRHSRVRLDELEQAAESNPEVVPEIAERFYTSLERAAVLGGEPVAAEVAALRTSASLLMDRIARNLDPSIAESLTVARTTRNDTTSSPSAPDRARQALAGPRSGDGADGDGGDPEPAGTDGASGDSDSSDEAPEPMAPEPETTVADAGQEDEPAELVEETRTAEAPAETIVADPAETGTAGTDLPLGEADGEDGEAGQENGAGDDAAGDDAAGDDAEQDEAAGDDAEQDEAAGDDAAGDDAEQDEAAGDDAARAQPEDGPSLEGRTPESATAKSGSASKASTSKGKGGDRR